MQTRGSKDPAARIASAISRSSLTRKPVRPCSTISANAPEGNAITGVPQANASIATSELVSGAMLGTSRQRAAASRRRFRLNPTGPRNLMEPLQRGAISFAKYSRCVGKLNI